MAMILHHIHRRLWQRLPKAWRRAALFSATGLVAPRPTTDVKPGLPILIAGAFRTTSGLGESARLCHDALKAVGENVYGIDLTTGLMQPEDYPEFAFADGRLCDGPGTIILHVNSPLVPLAMLRLGRRIVREKRIIGYWAWELPRVPADWRHGVRFVHEIWVPSHFTAEAVSSIVAGRPVHVMPHPVALLPPVPRSCPRAGDSSFTVLTIFNTASSFARKNPCAAIEAFRRAFGSDPGAQLIVKASNLSAFPVCFTLIKEATCSADNIVVLDKTMSPQELAALYTNADVVMSLHRAEGFGLNLAEGMMRGLPVVATNWSGNVDFLTVETGIPIPYRLVPAEDPQGTYQHPEMSWADADVEAAAAALRRLRDDPAFGSNLGQAATQFAAHAWSAESYKKAVRQHLGL